MRTCHNMNITVQTTGGDASSLNGKSEIPDKILANVTRDLLLNLINKKELWCFSYQYDIWLFRWTKNRLRGDVPYFIWHGIRPSYKHIQLWGVRGYIINGRDKKSNLMTDHIEDILRDMQLLHEFFYTGNHIKTILFTEPIMFGLMNIIIASTQKTSTLQVP